MVARGLVRLLEKSALPEKVAKTCSEWLSLEVCAPLWCGTPPPRETTCGTALACAGCGEDSLEALSCLVVVLFLLLVLLLVLLSSCRDIVPDLLEVYDCCGELGLSIGG